MIAYSKHRLEIRYLYTRSLSRAQDDLGNRGRCLAISVELHALSIIWFTWFVLRIPVGLFVRVWCTGGAFDDVEEIPHVLDNILDREMQLIFP